MKRLFSVLLILDFLIASLVMAGTPYMDGDKLVFSNEDPILTMSAIREREIVDWSLSSITYQYHSRKTIGSYFPPICNYVGTWYRQKFIVITWKGKNYELELQREEIVEKEKPKKSEICPEN
jgi:hypothetical protein